MINVKICHAFSKLLSLGGGKQNRGSWPLSLCSFSNLLPPTEHLQRANIFLNVGQYEFFGYFDKLVTNTFSQSLGSFFILFVVSFTVQKLFCLMQFHCLFFLLFTYPEFSLVTQLHHLFAIPWTAALQASLSNANSRACSNSWPLSQGCHPTISSSIIPLSGLQSFPASGSFSMNQYLHQVTKVLEFQLQHQSFQ